MVSKQLIEWLNPETTAMLVIDMERGYASADAPFPKLMGFDTTPIEKMIPNLEKFIEEARKYDVPIIWARFAEARKYANPRIVEKMDLDGTPDITDPDDKVNNTFDYYILKPKPGDQEFTKYDYSALTVEELHSYLQKIGTETLIGTGIYTGRCIDSTMRDAQPKGYRWIMPEDLVAAPQQLMHEHEATLSVCRAIFGHVLKSNDITSAWSTYKVKG